MTLAERSIQIGDAVVNFAIDQPELDGEDVRCQIRKSVGGVETVVDVFGWDELTALEQAVSTVRAMGHRLLRTELSSRPVTLGDE